MLTHEIQVVKPTHTKSVSGKMEFRRRQRLKQDLKNRHLRVSDGAVWNNSDYVEIIEIIYDYNSVTEWDGVKPLNVVVRSWESDEDFYVNIFDLEALR